MTKVTNPDGNFRETSYPLFNEVSIDENKHKTEAVKDAFGRTLAVKEFEGNGSSQAYQDYATTSYQYDAVDRLRRITDEFDNPTQITYNMLGFRTQVVDPDMGTWDYTYYDDGLLNTQSDSPRPGTGARETITFQYDSFDRITTKNYSGPVTVAGPIQYFYDVAPATYVNGRGLAPPRPDGSFAPLMPDGSPKGRLTRVVDWAGEHLFSYDDRGRQTFDRHVVSTTTYDVEHSYDFIDREVTTKYPSDGMTAEQITRAYDQQGLLESISTSLGGQYLKNTDYNAATMPEKLVMGNDLNVHRTYRPIDLRLERIHTGPIAPATTSLLDYRYTYDAKGNIASLQDPNDGTSGSTAIFEYDQLDRVTDVTGLKNATGQLTTMEYVYDEIGNMEKKLEGGFAASDYSVLAYDKTGPLPHAVKSATTTTGEVHTYGYDSNGNTLSEAVTGETLQRHSYTYDAEGRTATRTSSGVTEGYIYDYAGNLVKKTSPSGDTIYIAGIYERKLTTPAVVTKYYHAGSNRIAMRVIGSSSPGLFFFTQDHLGSTALITSGASPAAMTSRIRFVPYGSIRSWEGMNVTDKLFTGQQRETVNGIYHYNARLNNTDIGRFPQADYVMFDTDRPAQAKEPVESALGIESGGEASRPYCNAPRDRTGLVTIDPTDPQLVNRYSYVRNNPVMHTDPTGHFIPSFDFNDFNFMRLNFDELLPSKQTPGPAPAPSPAPDDQTTNEFIRCLSDCGCPFKDLPYPLDDTACGAVKGAILAGCGVICAFCATGNVAGCGGCVLCVEGILFEADRCVRECKET